MGFRDLERRPRMHRERGLSAEPHAISYEYLQLSRINTWDTSIRTNTHVRSEQLFCNEDENGTPRRETTRAMTAAVGRVGRGERGEAQRKNSVPTRGSNREQNSFTAQNLVLK